MDGRQVIMKFTRTLHSLKDTEYMAYSLASYLFPGFVVGLSGDLGAGKTTFTQYLAKAMGIDDIVNSPTFTIMKTYGHDLPLYHIDAYRLEGTNEDFELEEYISGDGVAVVEWYPHIEMFMPSEYLAISFTWAGEEKRHCVIEGRGPYEDIAKILGA